MYSRHRLERAISKLKRIRGGGSKWEQASVPIGIVGVVTLKLLNGSTSFTEQEELVLDAFRRYAIELKDATPKEIGEYLGRFSSPAELAGIENNVKGIHHEIAYVDAENTDGDQYEARLFPETNHPEADVEILDADTGEVIEKLQLKATDSVAQVATHLEKYQNISIQVTEELSKKMGVEGSGFNNEDLSNRVRTTIDKLSNGPDFHEILGTTVGGAITASLVTFLVCAGDALRRGKRLEDLNPDLLKERTKDAMKLGGVAALVVTLIS